MDLLQNLFRKPKPEGPEETAAGEPGAPHDLETAPPPPVAITPPSPAIAPAMRWRLDRERGTLARPEAPRILAGPPPNGEVVLELDDILPRIPTECLQPGLHDPDRELRFPSEDLVPGIARGRATLPLSKLAARYPEIFRAPRTVSADLAVQLPLQKILHQLGGPSGNWPRSNVLAPVGAPPSAAKAEELLRPSVHGDLLGVGPFGPPPLVDESPLPEMPAPPMISAPLSIVAPLTPVSAGEPVETFLPEPEAAVSHEPKVEPVEIMPLASAPSESSPPNAPSAIVEAEPSAAPAVALLSFVKELAAVPPPVLAAPLIAVPTTEIEPATSALPGVSDEELAQPPPLNSQTATAPVATELVADEEPTLPAATVAAAPAAPAPLAMPPAPLEPAAPPPIPFAKPVELPAEPALVEQPAPAVPPPAFAANVPAAVAQAAQAHAAMPPRVAPPPLAIPPAPRSSGSATPTPAEANTPPASLRLGSVIADAPPPPAHTAAGTIHIAPPMPAHIRPPVVRAFAPYTPPKAMPVTEEPLQEIALVSAAPAPEAIPAPAAPMVFTPEPILATPAEDLAAHAVSTPPAELTPEPPVALVPPAAVASVAYAPPAEPAQPPPPLKAPAPEPEPIFASRIPLPPPPPVQQPHDYPLEFIDQEPLQAIFMTDELLDLPRISQLSANLPGVSGCLIVAGESLAQGGERPAGLDAQTLRALSAALSSTAAAVQDKLPAERTFTMYGGNRALSIFARDELCLCIVHGIRGFLPGVRERLTAVADTLCRRNLLTSPEN